MSLTCELSGEPLNTVEGEIVVTPSGHVCQKRLLLSKLAENGGTDPFDADNSRPLTEDELVTLSTATSKKILPPRPHATSLPSLLSLMQREYDAMVLELFDTRKALEETRRELSQALYQNDAAVRVVARLAMERDAARQELQTWNAEAAAGAAAPAAEAEEPEAKRRRVEADESSAPAAGAAEEGTATSIPKADMTVMVDTWKALSKARKQQKSKTVVSNEDLAKYTQLDTKSWHKTSKKPGITALARHKDVIVTAARDKQIIAYNNKDKTLIHTISKIPKFVESLDVNDKVIVSGGNDSWIRVYSAEDGAYLSGVDLGDDKGHVLNVTIHPSGQHILACTDKGFVTLCSLSQDGEAQLITSFRDEDTTYTCGALHPDGLIYGAGTSRGEIRVWDLKSQTLASTLKQQDDNDDNPITALAFSNNGYHIAAALEHSVQVWDLRKLKLLATLNSDGDGLLKTITTVAFDDSGKHLAYGGHGGVHITTVKEWGITAKLGDGNKKHSVSGILWADEDSMVVTCSDKERPLRFHGLPEADDDDKIDEE